MTALPLFFFLVDIHLVLIHMTTRPPASGTKLSDTGLHCIVSD